MTSSPGDRDLFLKNESFLLDRIPKRQTTFLGVGVVALGSWQWNIDINTADFISTERRAMSDLILACLLLFGLCNSLLLKVCAQE